jgi:hypothetical protein
VKKAVAFLKKSSAKNFYKFDAMPFTPPEAQSSKSFFAAFFFKKSSA